MWSRSAAQWRPWKCRGRVLAGLGETEEITAAAARLDNPIRRVSVQALLAAVQEVEAESRSAEDGDAAFKRIPPVANSL